MVTLEVTMDAQGVVRGARDAMQSLNQASNSVQHMMDLLVNLGGAGAAGGVMGRFATAVSRWQPALLVATTAFSAINLALSAFKRTANDAADAATKLEASWSELFNKEQVGLMMGDPMALLTGNRSRVEQMQRAAEAIFSANQEVSASDIARMTGMNTQMVMQRWAQENQPDLWRQMGDLQGSSFSEPEWGQRMFYPREAIGIIANRQRELRSQSPASPGSNGFGLGPMFRGNESGGLMTDEWSGVRISDEDQQRVTSENQEAALRRYADEMREIEMRAQRIGDTLASGFLRAATGAATVQQIVGEMLMDIAQSALASGFSNVAEGFMKGFNATPTQRAT